MMMIEVSGQVRQIPKALSYFILSKFIQNQPSLCASVRCTSERPRGLITRPGKVIHGVMLPLHADRSSVLLFFLASLKITAPPPGPDLFST